MIATGAKLSIRRISLGDIVVCKYDVRFPGTLNSYIDLLIKNPECEPEPLHVSLHPKYPDLFQLENGYHRFMAAIATGRKTVLCIVEEPGEAGQ